jgi:hypothetical protein
MDDDTPMLSLTFRPGGPTIPPLKHRDVIEEIPVDRRRKISDSQIRTIFKSPEPAKALGSRFGVSEQMVYLIRSRRVHNRITKGLKRGTAIRTASAKIDTVALADAIIDRLIRRLRLRDVKKPPVSSSRPVRRGAAA